jgi:outer membrane protein assembly factor BamB
MVTDWSKGVSVGVAALALSACSAQTLGPSDVTSTRANLWAKGSCDTSCTTYLRYRQVGTSNWTETTHLTVGKVNPAVAWNQPATGLAADTQYEYQVCGQESTWSGPVCVGPPGSSTQTFFTAPASTFGSLAQHWFKSYDAWPYAAKPTVANHVVYVGSWDGYERAYDESGNLKWATNLGQTTSCYFFGPYTQGVTSAPAADASTGILYLGDGTDNFDALDPNTGKVLWSVPTDTAAGNYNWSSPVIYKGHAYIGTSSFCDDPLTQGKLLSINLATHQVDATFKVVPDGQTGGGIWTSPVVDPATNTVFVTTGTEVPPSQPLAESLVAVDAATLALKAHWQVQDDCNPTCNDLDWGTTPTLMSDSTNRQLIAAGSKDGYLYTFDRNNIGAGPIWKDLIAVGGGIPQLGEGTVSNGVFDGKYLYYAGGTATIGGKAYEGSVRAIDPATGHYVWERGIPGVPMAALATANGEIVAPAYDIAGGAGLWLLNAATGNIDYANAGDFYAPPTVADGLLFAGDIYGNFSAFQFPSAPGKAVAGAFPVGPTAGRAPELPRTKSVHPIHPR